MAEMKERKRNDIEIHLNPKQYNKQTDRLT